MTSHFHFFNALFFALAFLLIIASIGLAYNSLGPPNILGHSSDEIAFQFVSITNNNCSAGGTTTCEAACPFASGATTYHVVSGGCISQNALHWRQMGQCDLPSCGSSSGNSWLCQDLSHVAGDKFIAYVTCLKGGQ